MRLSRGLALFWRDTHEVEILHSSGRIIDARIKTWSLTYYMSFVYKDLVRHICNKVWEQLKSFGLNRNDGWCWVGDFNEIMIHSEKIDGPSRHEAFCYPFRSFTRVCRLKEVPSSGIKISLSGVREVISNGIKENVWIQCRLDRDFGNAEWFRLFWRSHGQYLERLWSCHRPIMLTLAASTQNRRGRFVFDKWWSEDPEVVALIKRGQNLAQCNNWAYYEPYCLLQKNTVKMEEELQEKHQEAHC